MLPTILLLAPRLTVTPAYHAYPGDCMLFSLMIRLLLDIVHFCVLSSGSFFFFCYLLSLFFVYSEAAFLQLTLSICPCSVR